MMIQFETIKPVVMNHETLLEPGSYSFPLHDGQSVHLARPKAANDILRVEYEAPYLRAYLGNTPIAFPDVLFYHLSSIPSCTIHHKTGFVDHHKGTGQVVARAIYRGEIHTDISFDLIDLKVIA